MVTYITTAIECPTEQTDAAGIRNINSILLFPLQSLLPTIGVNSLL